MTHFVGLDVSVRTTQICIIKGKQIIKEGKTESDPESIAMWLAETSLSFEYVGLEAGPLSQWLYAGLARARLPVVCVETRHAKAFLSARLNKTDKNDARGLAEMMQAGLFVPVHVKTAESQLVRSLLRARKFTQWKLIDTENNVRGILRNYGLKVGTITRKGFEERVRELMEGEPEALQATVFPLLTVRRVLVDEFAGLHKQMLELVKHDETCKLLMTCPGVGPFVALTFKSSIDIPERFNRSRGVGAHVGLTPRRYQSGEIDRSGRISKSGDPDLRTALVEAAGTLLRLTKKNCALKAWGLRIAKRRGMQKATVAVARRMAIILHRMWIDGTEFRWSDQDEAQEA